MKLWWAVCIVLLCTPTVSTANALPDNANVVRQASGVIAYRSLSTGAIRGEERFHISVHPDGSRSVMAVSRYGPRDIQRQSLYRIDVDNRPIDATLQWWIEGAWRASGLITVDKANLSASSRGPASESSHNIVVTDRFAVLPHQLSPDAWRVLLYDKTLGGVQPLTMYDLDPLAEEPDGLLGKITTQRFEYKGEVSIDVPAGTFVTDHFRLEDAIDMYVTGPDAILVKWRFEAIDREHVLMKLESAD